MDPQRQKLLLGVMLAGGLGYLAYSNVYVPRGEEITALEARLETLETQNRAARVLVERQGRDEVERQLADQREQLVRVEGLIPSSEELPDLLDAISAEAQRTGVELALIQPVGATAETFYTRRTYDLAVTGAYHQIAAFLTKIGSLQRIITPINLNLAVREEGEEDREPKLEAKFSIETYVLPIGATPTTETTHAD